MRVFLILFGIALTPVVLAIITEYLEIKRKSLKPQSKKNKSKSREKKKSFAGEKALDDSVYLECISALRGLGMNITDSKIKTKLMFSNRNYNRVEDFLMDVYKNE